MASVTQCDVCNNVCKHEESRFIKVWRCNKYNETSSVIHEIEVCPECYKKFCCSMRQEVK